MKRHIPIFAFLLSVVPAFAENVFVFSSHQTTVTDAGGIKQFNVYSESTQGYSDGSQGTSGFALCDASQSLLAGVTDGTKRFIGWYSKAGGWVYNLENVSVESANTKLSDDPELTGEKIKTAGEYGPSSGSKTKVVVAKYVSLYKIEAEVVPAGAGTVSGTNTYEEGKSVLLKASADSGYAFKEWSTNDVVLSSSPELEFTAASDTAGTYTASFTGKVYTVTFGQQGGTGGADSVQAQYMEPMPGLIAVPELYGYTFGGYHSEPDGKGTQYYTSDGESAHVWDKDAGATLYAEWIPQMGDLKLQFSTGVEKICYRLGESAVWTTNTADTTVQVQVGTKIHAYGIPAAGYEITDYHRENQWYVEKMPKDGITFKPTAREMTPVYTVTFVDPTGAHGPVQESVEGGASAKAPADWTRRGYALSWDKPLGPITAETTITAVWMANHYVIAFDGNGGAGEMEDLEAVYGKEIALMPNAFTKGILTFLHWTATVDGKTCTFTDGETVSNLTDVAWGTNTLSAVWGEDYLVEFDANGATSGTMEQQRFFRGVRQSLSSNAYLRTGHTFLGWAADRENAVQEKVAYTNMEEVVNLAAVGTTNVLFATWSTNRFTIVFDENGGSGTMNDQTISYGHGQTLDKCAFTRPAPWEFTGWLDETTGLTYGDEAPADTLRTEDGARVVLKAQWRMEVGKLSEAMECTNLKWVDGDAKDSQTGWTVCQGVGYASDSSALHQASGVGAVMHARITSPGTLTFRWRPTQNYERLTIQLRVLDSDKKDYTFFGKDYTGSLESWDNQVEYAVPSDQGIDFSDDVFIEIFSWNLYYGASETYVDAMTWAPEGDEPKYADEDAEVTGFSMADGKLSLSFDRDGGLTYHIFGTNDVTASWPWPFVREIGADEVQPIQIDIKADEPKMFYRIRALIQ